MAMTAANANAQAERPDTPDVAGSTFSDAQNLADGDLVVVSANATASNPSALGSTNYIYASNYQIRIQYPAAGITEIAGGASFAFEPDRVKRGLDFTTINQRDRAAVSLAAIRIITIGGFPAPVTFTGSNFPTAAPWVVPAGCASKVKMNTFVDAAPTGFPYVAGQDVYQTANAVTQCSNAGLSASGMPSAGQDIMRSVFPASNDGTGFKAKATNLQ